MNSPLPSRSALKNFGRSSGGAVKSASCITSTSPFAAAKPFLTASPLPTPSPWLIKVILRSGFPLIWRSISSVVPSVLLPSTKIISVSRPILGTRFTTSAILPRSFLHGTTTETDKSSSCRGAQAGRAITSSTKLKKRNPGSNERK